MNTDKQKEEVPTEENEMYGKEWKSELGKKSKGFLVDFIRNLLLINRRLVIERDKYKEEALIKFVPTTKI